MAAEKFRMDAYYFGFTPTGVEVIDLILSAVACAGKAYHHTDQWTEATEPWHDKLRGSYPAEWIQRAAEDAAKQLDEAHAAIREVPHICLCAGGAGICGFCLWREKHAAAIARATQACPECGEPVTPDDNRVVCEICGWASARASQGTPGQGQGK